MTAKESKAYETAIAALQELIADPKATCTIISVTSDDPALVATADGYLNVALKLIQIAMQSKTDARILSQFIIRTFEQAAEPVLATGDIQAVFTDVSAGPNDVAPVCAYVAATEHDRYFIEKAYA